MEFLNNVLAVFRDGMFYVRMLGGVVLWYLLALGLAHLLFGSGQEAVRSAILGSWLSILLVTVAAVLLSLYLWSSTPLAIALGLMCFVVPVAVTLLLSRAGSTAT
jgi:hypothetical protein